MENRNRNTWIIVIVVVLLLLCCCLAAALVAVAAFFPAAGSILDVGLANVTERSEQVVAVGEAPALEIDNFVGDLVVRSGDSGEMRFIIVRRAGSDSDLARIDVDVSQVQDGVVITARRPGTVIGNMSVTIEAWVPAGTRLDLRTGVGDVQVRDVRGDVAVSTGTGDVDVSGAAASVALSTGVGEINYQGAPAGTCTFGAGTGEIRLHLPAGANVGLVLDTGVGEIDLGGFDVRGEVRRTHVEGTIGSGAQATIEARAGVGDIALIRR